MCGRTVLLLSLPLQLAWAFHTGRRWGEAYATLEMENLALDVADFDVDSLGLDGDEVPMSMPPAEVMSGLKGGVAELVRQSKGVAFRRSIGDNDEDMWLQFKQEVDVDLFRQKAVNGTAIIIVGNIGYVSGVFTWLQHFDQVKPYGMTARKNVTVVCADPDLYYYLKGKGHMPQLMEPLISDGNLTSADFDAISFIRHHVASTLNMHGLSILYSDADAVWLQNPLPDLFRAVRQDGRPGITAARGMYPYELRDKWGATACTGLLHYWGNLGWAFWKALNHVRHDINDGHDQHYLNVLLDAVGTRFDNQPIDLYNSTVADHGLIGGPGTLDMHITLLPHNGFPRKCELLHKEEVKVLHCVSWFKGDHTTKHKPLQWHDNLALAYANQVW